MNTQKHRYMFFFPPLDRAAGLSQEIENEGWEIFSAGPVPFGRQDGQGVILVLICARIDRDAAETEMERAAAARAGSRIVTLNGNRAP